MNLLLGITLFFSNEVTDSITTILISTQVGSSVVFTSSIHMTNDPESHTQLNLHSSKKVKLKVNKFSCFL